MSQTTNIRSVSTIATWPAYDELVLFIRSLRAIHPRIPLFILAQHKVAEQLAKDNLMDDHITITIGLEQFRTSSWKQESTRYKNYLMAHKALAMKAALKKYSNTLLVDCDILFLAPLPKVDETKDLGLHDVLVSHHVCQLDSNPSVIHSINDSVKRYRYHGGYVFVNHRSFPHQKWQVMRSMRDEGSADQQCLITLINSFSYFLFPIANCIFTYSLMARRKYLLRLGQLKTQPVLSYRNKPIGAIHCHFFTLRPFDIVHAFWLYVLYKSRSPWFDFINNYPGYPHHDPAELKKGCSYLFASAIRTAALHRKYPSTLSSKQHKYEKSAIRYYLIGIYKYLILSYYLVLETLFFHRVIRSSEFAVSKWKLLIATVGWTYGLLGTRYKKHYPYPPAKLNKRKE